MKIFCKFTTDSPAASYVPLPRFLLQDETLRDISNDGRTLVGLNVSGRGGFNPAFIRDGVLVQLFECGEEDSPEEEVNFNGGYIQTIDANGNMYGYYADPNNIPYFFTFTPLRSSSSAASAR